jgi:high-affinity K+ transport system ATPase subunit B
MDEKRDSKKRLKMLLRILLYLIIATVIACIWDSMEERRVRAKTDAIRERMKAKMQNESHHTNQ